MGKKEQARSKCEECLHYDLCEALGRNNVIQMVHPSNCAFFKNKADLAMAEKEHVEREELKVLCPLMVASAHGTTKCGENRCAWWVPGGRGKCAIKEIANTLAVKREERV